MRRNKEEEEEEEQEEEEEKQGGGAEGGGAGGGGGGGTRRRRRRRRRNKEEEEDEQEEEEEEEEKPGGEEEEGGGGGETRRRRSLRRRRNKKEKKKEEEEEQGGGEEGEGAGGGGGTGEGAPMANSRSSHLVRQVPGSLVDGLALHLGDQLRGDLVILSQGLAPRLLGPTWTNQDSYVHLTNILCTLLLGARSTPLTWSPTLSWKILRVACAIIAFPALFRCVGPAFTIFYVLFGPGLPKKTLG